LVNHVSIQNEIDYVFYDSGPNIGPLNRVILLDCDYFAIPAACDLFSLSAIKTLGHTLTSWIEDWQMIADLAPDEIYLLPGKPKLLGYIPQRFRIWSDQPSKEYAKLFPRIEKQIQSEVVSRLRRIDQQLVPSSNTQLKLGEIKDFGSSAIKSQTTGNSITDQAFVKIANKIIDRTSLVRIS
jgi:cellulose biosynthesis protein BcsQ